MIVKQQQPLLGVYVGRQPIFNREMQLYAYELLFRNGDGRNALIEKTGVMGEALSCVLAIEQGKIEQTSFMQMNAGEISSHYMRAMCWTRVTWANLSK